jgi:hypothetical protein
MVGLLPGWSDYSHQNPEGPATFLRESSKVPGPLQVSLIGYRGGEIPNPSLQSLVNMASEMGDTLGATELVETTSGDCAFGRFGSAVFRSVECPRMQVWYLSDGYDFILATHICGGEPDWSEVAEVEEIVKRLTVESRQLWKFW